MQPGALRELPHVRDSKNAIVPRVVGLAEGFFQANGCAFDEEALTTFLNGYQDVVVLDLRELWALVPALKLALLEQIAACGAGLGSGDPGAAAAAGACVRGLEAISHVRWKEVLEDQIVFDEVLEQDPAGAYSKDGFRQPRSLPSAGCESGSALGGERGRSFAGCIETGAGGAAAEVCGSASGAARRARGLLPD